MIEAPSTGGLRIALIRVLIYAALALMPANLPIPEALSKPPHAIVQPTDGPEPALDDLVALLGVVASGPRTTPGRFGMRCGSCVWLARGRLAFGS